MSETVEAIDLFVFVVESPSAQDIYDRRSEGEILRTALELGEIRCAIRTTVDRTAFETALRTDMIREISSNPGMIPILHISAHGNKDGIAFSNGEAMTWSILRTLLAEINAAVGGFLIVCLSSCEGVHGTRMAMFLEDDSYPFYAIIASGDSPTWSETAVAFLVFYHLISGGNSVVEAVKAMRMASGHDAFYVKTAKDARQGFLEYLNGLRSQQQ